MVKLYLWCLLLMYGLVSKSQTCETYFPFTRGSEFEQKNYNEKNKLVSTGVYRILESKEISGGIEAKVHSDIFDAKNKIVSTADYRVICNNGDLEIDMRSFLTPEMMSQYQNMEMKIEDAFINIPSRAQAGASLKDGKMKAEIFNDGQLFTIINIDVTNRKIVGIENITTTAGAFDAVKISYDVKIESSTMGIKIPVLYSILEWYVKGLGPVKSESYTKNGKLKGTTVMTKVP